MSEKLCIFHADCIDGFTAAWVVSRHVAGWNEATFYPASYGEDPPDVEGTDVIIVDFSYPRGRLEHMYKQAQNSLRVLDHHKTAQAELVGLGYCTFDMERSGAGLAWDELVRPVLPRPLLIEVVEDRDLWRFDNPSTKAIHPAIEATDMTFEAWDHLAERKKGDLIHAGTAIQAYLTKSSKSARATAKKEVLQGHFVSTLNLQGQSASEVLNDLLAESNDQFVVGYFRRADGKWQMMLRSRPDFDCSVVAQHFGGGGHAQAAGFVMTKLPW